MVFLPVLYVKVNLSVNPSVVKVCCTHKGQNHVMQLVYKQYEVTKDDAMMEMQQPLRSGKRFSL